jgi:polysaccharide biosynthesis protein PslH
VLGYVPDIRPYLQQATVAVVPAVYSAGIQNKELEAMTCGTPVVATERAISALNLKPEHDISVANEAEAFARQVLKLLANSNLRQTIGSRGLEHVRRYHAWPQVGANLEVIYRTVIENHMEL